MSELPPIKENNYPQNAEEAQLNPQAQEADFIPPTQNLPPIKSASPVKDSSKVPEEQSTIKKSNGGPEEKLHDGEIELTEQRLAGQRATHDNEPQASLQPPKEVSLDECFYQSFNRLTTTLFQDLPNLDYQAVNQYIYNQEEVLNETIRKVQELPANKGKNIFNFDHNDFYEILIDFENLLVGEVQKILGEYNAQVDSLRQLVDLNNNYVEAKVLSIIEQMIKTVKYVHLNSQAILHLVEKFDRVLEVAQFHLVFKVHTNVFNQLSTMLLHKDLVVQYFTLVDKVNFYKQLQSQPVMASLQILENHFLLYQQNVLKDFKDQATYLDQYIIKDQLEKERVHEKPKAIYSYLDLWLILIHTHVYMLNYYGYFPNASQYTAALKLDEGISGAIQAATPIGAAISCFYYTWHSKLSTLKQAYVVSWLTFFLGNLLYVVADAADSVVIVVLARLLFGWGGARVLTRTFVSNQVAFEYRTKYQAMIVALTSLSMTFGPGLAAFLQYVPEFQLFGTFYVRSYTILPYVLIVISFVGMVVFQFLFQDKPSHLKFCCGYRMRTEKMKNPEFWIHHNKEFKENNAGNFTGNIAFYYEIDHLLIAPLSFKEKLHLKSLRAKLTKNIENLEKKGVTKNQNQVGSDTNNLMSDRGAIQQTANKRPVNDFLSDKDLKIYEQLAKQEEYFNEVQTQNNINDLSINHDYETRVDNDSKRKNRFLKAVSVCYQDGATAYACALFFFMKMCQEAVLVEYPIMMRAYNSWSVQSIGFTYLGYTIVSLPSSLLPAFLSKRVQDRTMVLVFQVGIIIGCLVKINYQYNETMHPVHYVICSGFLFCMTLIVEGSSTAMLAKVISFKQNMTLFNSGMLAGLSDTIGRAVGSTLITVFSRFDSVRALPFYLWVVFSVIAVILFLVGLILRPRLKKIQYVKLNE